MVCIPLRWWREAWRVVEVPVPGSPLAPRVCCTPPHPLASPPRTVTSSPWTQPCCQLEAGWRDWQTSRPLTSAAWSYVTSLTGAAVCEAGDQAGQPQSPGTRRSELCSLGPRGHHSLADSRPSLLVCWVCSPGPRAQPRGQCSLAP